jgi:tRNA nucleotidyltransferase (CCA-adding enzyme)
MPANEVDPARLSELVERLPGIDAVRNALSEVPAYLVGGAVRDLLLGIENVDLDVAIEGDSPVLAKLPGFTPERDSMFLTGRLKIGGHEIDVAQARAETYPRPGALPEVRPASITDDLARRDFTINATAFPLSDGGELIDPHAGIADLRAGVLRVLHDESFVDDPTRALRAARYAARFDFELEPQTEKLLESADLSTVTDDRIQNELRRTAAEPDPAKVLRLISEWGVLPSLDPDAPDRVGEVARLASQPPWSDWVDRELAVTIATVRPLPQVRELAAATPERASEGVRLAQNWDPAQLLVARALGAEWLDSYAAEWRHVRLQITGEDLLSAGVEEGPAVGRGLEAALSGRLDGEISGRDDELQIAIAAARHEIPED